MFARFFFVYCLFIFWLTPSKVLLKEITMPMPSADGEKKKKKGTREIHTIVKKLT